MRKNYLLLFITLLLSFTSVIAQSISIKTYNKSTKAGDVGLVSSWGELNGNTASRLYVIDVTEDNKYYINTLSNLLKEETVLVFVDDQPFEKLRPQTDGWQNVAIRDYFISLGKGNHKIRFQANYATNMVPMVDEIFLTVERPAARTAAPAAVTAFLNKVEQLKQQPVVTANDEEDLTSKVLPNPQGLYDHAIDTNFTYSHFSWIYLTTGYHTFATSGSTIFRTLTVFNPNNYTYSWSNVNSGPGGESLLNLYVSLAGYYAITLRPYAGITGVTNILHNGTTLVSGAVIGGRTYSMSALKGGPLNFFTCRMSGGGDTRMMASRSFSSSVRGY
ncbi:MAG: hypothetical protein ABL876_15860, partial [Chitinophagaceae bacterium]